MGLKGERKKEGGRKIDDDAARIFARRPSGRSSRKFTVHGAERKETGVESGRANRETAAPEAAAPGDRELIKRLRVTAAANKTKLPGTSAVKIFGADYWLPDAGSGRGVP